MKNEKLDAFLYSNRLKSSDLVEFWGVTKGGVSQILNGTTKLPTKRLNELLNNDKGWDTSMLVDSPVPVLESAAPAMNLSNVEILLREMLAEKEAKIDALNEIIWELKAENAMLKEQIKYKGAHAEGAAGSFAADAV
jgi:hypothetical protein